MMSLTFHSEGLCSDFIETLYTSMKKMIKAKVFFLEREREYEQERRAHGERERIPIRLHSQCRARCRAQSHDPGIMT